MNILAIETSCDETSVAVLEVKRGVFNLRSHLISSQEKIHAKYGGIVPEVAARHQMEMILPIIEETIKKAKIKLKDIDYIAVTSGPGLITSLTVGVETAKTLALTLNKPLVPINHLAGHLLANYLSNTSINYPALGLIVSGGHTMLVYIKNEIKYEVVGQTLDDAAGEAFDKVAKILGLGYPGGPVISKLALLADAQAFDLPRPMISQNNLNFSFSGLKTAVLYLFKKLPKGLSIKKTKDLCASFQQAVIDVLVSKTLRAIKSYSSSSADKKPKSFLLGGGVAANSELRRQLQEKIHAKYPGIQTFIPELKLTGDNAAMIAAAAYFQIKHKKYLLGNKIKTLRADPNLSL